MNITMQALRARLAILLVSGASLLRTSCATDMTVRQVDSMSLVQMSLRTNSSDVEEGDKNKFVGLSLLQATSQSMTHMHIPGVKGIKEQLEEAANFKPAAPEPGFHKKLVKALPQLQGDCYKKLYATKDDCDMAVKMVQQFIKATDGPEPMWTWHGQIRMMMGLNFWLYTPGTSMCFPMLDRDQSGNVTLEEMEQLFGVQAVANSRAIWEFLDLNNDGGFTREELHKYLRASIMIREYLPQVDMMDSKADSRKCLNMAHRVLNPPPVVMKRLGFYPKLLSIAGIVVGAVALHCLLCSKRSSPKNAQ